MTTLVSRTAATSAPRRAGGGEHERVGAEGGHRGDERRDRQLLAEHAVPVRTATSGTARERHRQQDELEIRKRGGVLQPLLVHERVAGDGAADGERDGRPSVPRRIPRTSTTRRRRGRRRLPPPVRRPAKNDGRPEQDEERSRAARDRVDDRELPPAVSHDEQREVRTLQRGRGSHVRRDGPGDGPRRCGDRGEERRPRRPRTTAVRAPTSSDPRRKTFQPAWRSAAARASAKASGGTASRSAAARNERQSPRPCSFQRPIRSRVSRRSRSGSGAGSLSSPIQRSICGSVTSGWNWTPQHLSPRRKPCSEAGFRASATAPSGSSWS